MRPLRFIAAMLVCVAASSFDARAQQLTMTLDEARIVARNAFLSGNRSLAWQIASRLVEADPSDVQALILQSATAPDFGQPDLGRVAGRRAWQQADTKQLKHEAAFYAGRAALAEGKYGLAKLWLRRAHDTARDEATRANLAGQFGQLRAMAPVTTQLRFSALPSSNLNGGSETEFLIIDGLDTVGLLSGSAQALSGTRLTGDLLVRLRLSEGKGHKTQLSLRGYATHNILSDEARALAPDVDGRDLNQQVAEIGLIHQIAPQGLPIPDQYSLSYGHIWYGGAPLSDYFRLQLGRTVSIGPQTQLQLSAVAETSNSRNNGFDSHAFQGRIELQQGLPWGDQLGLFGRLDETFSDSPLEANNAWEVGLTYSLGRQIGPAQLSGTLRLRDRHFPDYIALAPVPGGRRDETWAVDLSARFVEFDYRGFAPVATIGMERTRSNVSRFEIERIGVTLSIDSVF